MLNCPKRERSACKRVRVSGLLALRSVHNEIAKPSHSLYSLEEKPPRAPLFLAALFFSGGILCAHYCWRPSGWILSAIAAYLFAAILFLTRRREHVAYVLALLIVTFLGFLALQFSRSADEATAQGSSLARFTTGEEITITAHVVKSPPSFGPPAERTVVDLETEVLDDGAGAIALQSGIRLSIYARRGNPEDEQPTQVPLLYGDRVQFVGKLREPRNFGNPGAWDYAGYLRQHGHIRTRIHAE